MPLRGLWNRRPPEGDRFVSAEIDWLAPGVGNCVQFQLSGNSPVAMSQIVALYVDNARCGSDITFMFGDSGFLLVVPAYAEGLYPVLSNALMFYCSAPQAAPADISVVQILNSIPPPIPVQLSQQMQTNILAGSNLAANGSSQVAPASVSGTLNAFTLNIYGVGGAGGGNATITLVDGLGHVLWGTYLSVPATTSGNLAPMQFNNLKIRFVNGISLVVAGSTMGAGSTASINIYYSVP